MKTSLRYQPGLKKANFRNFRFQNVQTKPFKSFLLKKVPQKKTLFQCKVIARNSCHKIGSNAFEKKRDLVRFRLQRQGGGNRKNRLARIGLNP